LTPGVRSDDECTNARVRGRNLLRLLPAFMGGPAALFGDTGQDLTRSHSTLG
jgi:hypothetical protein